MLFQCWSVILDAGPTLKQHWTNAPCLPGRADRERMIWSQNEAHATVVSTTVCHARVWGHVIPYTSDGC